MRFLVYNIAYGTGGPAGNSHRVLTSHRYLKTHDRHFEKIIDFIKKANVDIVGLLEIDTGSYRTDQINQVKKIADRLNHFHVCDTKYGRNSLLRKIPYLRNQSNALLTASDNGDSKFHYLPRGMKKLVIESTINQVTFFLVHLALTRKVRQIQLEYLVGLIPENRPVIVAGDFNTMQGCGELRPLLSRCGLKSANRDNRATYPAWGPQKELDYILCSEGIRINGFEIPPVKYSDHQPLILDFEVE
ncbi:MAG: endonuclease/exonuclease/phosphatase family protein [Victivallaceae bacterium]|nr:endonuclease/exonuclease/phosphatase family protein [Victivallaceae bacterium]